MLYSLPLSWLSLIYCTGVNLLMLPVVLRLLGAEAFGLVGFFSAVQSVFLFADLGLPALMGRMAALQTSTGTDPSAYGQQQRDLYRIVTVTVGVVSVCLWLASDWIVGQWLKPQHLQADTVQTAFMAMVVCAGMRVLGGVDVAVLNGLNEQRWLAWFSMAMATLKLAGVWVSMYWFGATPQVYWTHMVVAHLIEWRLWRQRHLLVTHCISSVSSTQPAQPMSECLKMAWGLFGNSLLWTLMFGMPLLLASGVLPLSELGYLTLALTLANGIRLLGETVHSPLKTKLTHLYAQGQTALMWQTYRQASWLMTALVIACVCLLIAVGEPLLNMWTGHQEQVPDLSFWLVTYAGGHAMLSLAGLPLDWLYAQGLLSRSLPVQALLMAPWVLALNWAMQTHGGLWAGWIWLVGATVQWLALSAWVHLGRGSGVKVWMLWREMAIIALPVASVTVLLKGWR